MDGMSRTDRAVFRLPAASLVLPLLAVLCVTPLATVGGAWAALFVVPGIALLYALLTRTTADSAGLAAHGLLGTHRMTWSQLGGLEFQGSRWAVAVGTEGTRLRLPMVRPRDLPRLAAVAGGSLALEPPDPDGDAAVLETPTGPGGAAGSSSQRSPSAGVEAPGEADPPGSAPDPGADDHPDSAAGSSLETAETVPGCSPSPG
jgi:Bacterial PH domain